MKRLLIPLLLLSTPVWAGNVEVHSKNVGPWTVTSYADEQSKAFSHCVALTTYDAASEANRKLLRTSSMTLFVKLLSNGNISISLGGMDWNFPEGRTFGIRFDFEDKAWSEMDGIAVNSQVLTVEAEADKDASIWYVSLAKNKWVEISIEGKSLGRFNLNNSRKALEALMDCYTGSMEANSEKFSGNTFGEGRE